MNDRFKFRVWCKNKKEWEKDEIMITNNGKYIVTSSDIKKPFLITDADPIHHEINFCTGLKDKNGKLIYEGDIVKSFHVSSTMQGRVFIGFVIYDDERCRYCILENKHCGYVTFSNTDDVFEVIGNIYENEDLLNDN